MSKAVRVTDQLLVPTAWGDLGLLSPHGLRHRNSPERQETLLADALIVPSSCYRQHDKCSSILLPTQKLFHSHRFHRPETGAVTEGQLSAPGSDTKTGRNKQPVYCLSAVGHKSLHPWLSHPGDKKSAYIFIFGI